MSTKEIIANSLGLKTTQVKVRDYPDSYKGSMRGCVDVQIKDRNYDLATAKKIIREVLPIGKEFFVTVDWR